MKTKLEQAKKAYLVAAYKQAKETFDYFQVGNAFENGAETVEKMADSVFNEFLKKCGVFIQGLDSEEIYDMYAAAKEEVFGK